MRDVCVIGLGLIGGSVLRCAAASGRNAWGADVSEMDVEAAAEDGRDVSADVPAALRRAHERDALVILAVPLTAIDEVTGRVATHAPRCVLTDVASVKAPVLASVRRLLPAARYVGSHPMAGSAASGWRASEGGLFRGAAWVACVEDDTDLDAWAEVARLAIDAGAHVVPVSATPHDAAVARISHLPHLFAAILAAVGVEGGALARSLAAGSFTDGSRVAHTRPELVRAMTEGNREALLPVLDEALGKLGAARGSLASTGGLAATINAGHAATQTFANLSAPGSCAGVSLDLSAIQARDGLCALGERGGRITDIEGDTATGMAG